jgi:hypothetical protein
MDAAARTIISSGMLWSQQGHFIAPPPAEGRTPSWAASFEISQAVLVKLCEAQQAFDALLVSFGNIRQCADVFRVFLRPFQQVFGHML